MFRNLAQIGVLVAACVLSSREQVYAQQRMADPHPGIESHAKRKKLTGSVQLLPKPRANTLGLNWDLSRPISRPVKPIKFGPPSTFWPIGPSWKQQPTEERSFCGIVYDGLLPFLACTKG